MNRLMFSIFSFVLVAQIFLGTTGVIVYEHHCKKDGTSRSLFFEQEHDRDRVEEIKSCAANSCCSSIANRESNIPTVDREACCSNSINFVQLDTDLALEKNGFRGIGLFSAPIDSPTEKFPAAPTETSFCYRGPPPISTLERLASLQTYII